MDNYEEIKKLPPHNEKVLLAIEKATGIHVIIKPLKLELIEGKNADRHKEVGLLQMFRHRHIVSYISSFTDKATRTINIVMSYCPGGDLNDWIQKHREDGTSFCTADIVMILRQLCEALAYIHNQNILHRDIKPQNIFVENSWTVKLGDFGISKILESTLDYAETHNVGTSHYLAPEVLKADTKGYRQKCDMWSLGCVLYEVITLERAFPATDWHNVVSQIINDPHPPLPVHVDRNLADLTAELLLKNPDERPNAKQILARQFVHQQPPSQAVSRVEFLQMMSMFDQMNKKIEGLGNQIEGINKKVECLSNEFEGLESKFALELNKTKSEMFAFIEKEAHLIKYPADDKQGEYSFDFFIDNFSNLENSGKDMYSMPVYVHVIRSSVVGYVEFNGDGEMIVWLKFARHPRKVGFNPARGNDLKITATVVDIHRKMLPEVVIGVLKDVMWDESVITSNVDFGFEIGRVKCQQLLDKGYGQAEGYSRGAILVRFDIDARSMCRNKDSDARSMFGSRRIGKALATE